MHAPHSQDRPGRGLGALRYLHHLGARFAPELAAPDSFLEFEALLEEDLAVYDGLGLSRLGIY